MISENRDPSFWAGVASHPMVAPHVTFGQEVDWAPIVQSPRVLPLASEHGGFVFFQIDSAGHVCELHTLYTPEGWGQEVAAEAKRAFDEVFHRGFRIITTTEVEGNERSRPPRSYGWRASGDFAMVHLLDHAVKTWFLTVEAWGASPAKKRADRLCLS